VIGTVKAVFYYRYSRSAFRALYARITGQGGYTKDFLQVRQAVQHRLDVLFDRGEDLRVPIVYKWPGGQEDGHWGWTDVRGNLKWFTQNKPLPWTVGDPATNPAISLQATVGLTDPTLADNEYARIMASGHTPWLVGVILRDDPRAMHVRMYFDQAPAGFEGRDLDGLPEIISSAIREQREDCGIVEFAESNEVAYESLNAPELARKIMDALSLEPNVLLVGPPGTGKTVVLEDLKKLYSASNEIQFNTDTYDCDGWSTTGEARNLGLVFHPSYGYENFVAGLMPDGDEQGVRLKAQAGPLISLGHWSSAANRKSLLVLDEFNRGPAAAIFGDTLSLLDKEKRSTNGSGGSTILRPYHDIDMNVAQSFANAAGSLSIGKEITLPIELSIVAAMNSTDRSVAPLDAALRRRFTILRVGPDYVVLARKLGISEEELLQTQLPTSTDHSEWSQLLVAVLAVKILIVLNERIEFCLGEDFLLGHALFWKIIPGDPVSFIDSLVWAIETKILPTLKMTFLDQDEVLAAILSVSDGVTALPNVQLNNDRVAYWRAAPRNLAMINQKKLAFHSLESMATSQKIAALLALLEG
jgi:5-methylcytosine-specific restriction protein B